MGLEQYWKKRNFARTPEPQGEMAAAAAGLPVFVIQKHAASHLHYDFRLEVGGTLKSWAIPKGPSLDPSDKRLAVEVEDHPLAYAGFEGRIPEGEYGGGTVLLWDRGHWQPEGDAEEGLRKGRLRFRLQGEKLHGEWTLIRMGKAAGDGRHNWLLIKHQDEFARPDAEVDITEQRGESVLSGRDLAAIAADPEAAVHGGDGHVPPKSRDRTPRPRGGHTRAATRAAVPAVTVQASGRGRTALPEFMPPQLATLVEEAPEGGRWLTETKFDGYRLLARIDHGHATLWTRNHLDWSTRLPSIVAELARLPVKNAWLDGEVVAVDDEGRSSFSRLQQAFGKTTHHAAGQLLYFIFDLLFLDGHDLRGLPQQQRKQLLRELLKGGPQQSVRFTEHLGDHADEAYRHACQQGEEGILLKHADAAYVGERSRYWLKLKCGSRQEFVVGGYTDPAGSREEFGALLVGYYTPQQQLVYAGRVGTGFDAEWLGRLGSRLRALARPTSPFATAPSAAEARGAHWVIPELVVDVRFAGWTRLDRLRQAAFLGLREDKPAATVRREQPQSPPATLAAAPPAPARQAALPAAKEEEGSVMVAGVAITHPRRVIYSDAGLTKLDIAHYYERIAPRLLPQLAERPLTLLRCPQGLDSCFIQRHFSEGLPESLHGVEVQEETRIAVYMTADSLTAVLDLVQLGVLELHTWGARRDCLDRPDRVIFDLDPAPDIAWRDFVVYTRLVRDLLQELELPAFLKTTGGKGVHVEVPLQRVHDWEEVKAFAQAVAFALARDLPQHFVARAAKDERHGRIFVDYLRNAEGASAVAAYSTRARPGAPVALPIAWDELADTPPGRFTVRNVFQRLDRLRSDPWQDYESSRVRLGRQLLARLGVEDD